MASILPARMISIVDNFGSCVCCFFLQIFSKVGIRCIDGAQLYGLNFLIDDSVDTVHSLRPVEVPIGLEVVSRDFNTTICEIFHCFDKVASILIEVLIFRIGIVSPEIFESVIHFVMWPKVYEHDSVWFELVHPIEKEVIIILISCKRAPSKKNGNKSRQFVGSIGFLSIFVQFSKSKCSVMCVRVTIQDYKFVSPFICNCIED